MAYIRLLQNQKAQAVPLAESALTNSKTIKIRSIHVHYELAVPADALEATERALAAHPAGCPAHESVKGAIDVSWDARVRAGERTVQLQG